MPRAITIIFAWIPKKMQAKKIDFSLGSTQFKLFRGQLKITDIHPGHELILYKTNCYLNKMYTLAAPTAQGELLWGDPRWGSLSRPCWMLIDTPED